MNNLSKLIRTQEWWENKLPSVLALGYATSVFVDIPLIEVSIWMLYLLVAIIIGAIYVSTINDITDIQEDEKSGKRNRMAAIPKKHHWVIPTSCLIFGSLCFLNFLPDTFSAILYVLPWIAFSLYSFKPFRLKQRGIWGVFADASGAHLFIGLLMVSSVSYITEQTIDLLWLSLVGFWSLVFGLRGILWHQYYDRENDLAVHANTFATRVSPTQFKKFEKLLILLEILSFIGILLKLSLPILVFLLILYIILVMLRVRIMGHKAVIVLNPKDSPLQILMLDFYQVFFPLGILIHFSFTQKFAWIILLIHLLLFPGKLLKIINDTFVILRAIKRKLQGSFLT